MKQNEAPLRGMKKLWCPAARDGLQFIGEADTIISSFLHFFILLHFFLFSTKAARSGGF